MTRAPQDNLVLSLKNGKATPAEQGRAADELIKLKVERNLARVELKRTKVALEDAWAKVDRWAERAGVLSDQIDALRKA